MVSEHEMNRVEAIQIYGRKCYTCGQGELYRRGLFLRPVGFFKVGNQRAPYVPLCKVCASYIDQGSSVKAICQQSLRRSEELHATAKLRASQGGWAFRSERDGTLSPED